MTAKIRRRNELFFYRISLRSHSFIDQKDTSKSLALTVYCLQQKVKTIRVHEIKLSASFE